MAIPWKPAVYPSNGVKSPAYSCLGVIAHHTKVKGDLGVLKAQLSLFEQGFAILNPMTEHAPFDLVACKDGEFHRIQVKYRKLDSTGKLTVKFSTGWAGRHGSHSVPIDKDEVDLYCIYCPDTDECYYLRPKDHRSHASLRVETPKNNQQAAVRMATDFRRVP